MYKYTTHLNCFYILVIKVLFVYGDLSFDFYRRCCIYLIASLKMTTNMWNESENMSNM